MSAPLVRVVALIVCIACVLVSKWAYSHPKDFLDKFIGYGGDHGTLALRSIKFAGALWLFVGVYGTLADLFPWTLVNQAVSTQLLLAVFGALSTLITWQLLKRRAARRS